jgi:hypothetical protein
MTLEAGVTAIERHAHRGHLLSVATALIASVASVFSAGTFSQTSVPNERYWEWVYSPAHMPFPSDVDVEKFFDEAVRLGSGVVVTIDWHSLGSLARVSRLSNLARSRGLKLHLYLDPIALEGGRTTPSVPESAGGNSLGDPAVRRKFESDAVELARLRPDYLGLATEVNLFERNPKEYRELLSLVGETYRRVKKDYPALAVTVSFQWDTMSKSLGLLKQFSRIIDVYSFTSEPDAFGNAAPPGPRQLFCREFAKRCRTRGSAFRNSDGVPRHREASIARPTSCAGFRPLRKGSTRNT